uniref:RecQ-mediated genome instability protein 1 n=1 Tax=Haemonchus contortus TaxID=6289 RepID=A0A7I5EC67_HAECO
MEDVASVVFDFFMERHIVLKEEWLSVVLSFLTSSLEGKALTELNDPLRVATLVFEQWKYADLVDSTYPLLKQLSISRDAKKVFVTQPVVLQINSVVDIGAPYHSQFSALVYEFVDNTGFEPLPDMEQRQGLENIEAKPRRMLAFTVSDGESDLRAIEYYSIKSLSLLTKPGSKILLIPPVLCRKGVLLLKPKNIQFLGGDVESHFMIGRPLQVMAEKLNIPIPKSINRSNLREDIVQLKEPREIRTMEEPKDKRENVAAKPVFIPSGPDAPELCDEDYDFDPTEYDQEEALHGNEDFDMEDNNQNDGTIPASNSFEKTIGNSRPAAVFPESASTAESSKRICSKPVAQIPPMKTAESRSKAVSQGPECSIELEETPPDFDAELANFSSAKTSRLCASSSEKEVLLGRNIGANDNFTPASEDIGNTRKRSSSARAQTSLISLCDSQAETSGLKQISCASFDPGRRPIKLGIQGFLKSASPPVRRQTSERGTSSESTRKKVKIEVIDLEDDFEATTSSSSLTQYCGSTQTDPKAVESCSQGNSENELVVKFQKLNVVRIADALRQMRFAVGSCRKTVQAIVLDVVDSLRIVDGMWTMKVSIQDESSDSFMCLIDNPTLTSLIGLTSAEALEVRASSDIERRKDGQRRLGAVEEQLKRLDLLLDVELFSGSRADPVIRGIRTLMQALDL